MTTYEKAVEAKEWLESFDWGSLDHWPPSKAVESLVSFLSVLSLPARAVASVGEFRTDERNGIQFSLPGTTHAKENVRYWEMDDERAERVAFRLTASINMATDAGYYREYATFEVDTAKHY